METQHVTRRLDGAREGSRASRMGARSAAVALVVAWWLVGCGGGTAAPSDAADLDADALDIGLSDAGVDAEALDVGLTDAAVDAGALDAGASDAEVDAGALDVGPTDAGLDGAASDVGALDGGSPSACPDALALQAATDAELARQGITGATVHIDLPGCSFTGATGLADRVSGRPMDVHDGFRIASITKTFTAVVALQLIEEGKLGFGTLLTAYVPFPGAEAVTVRHLLAHTSGIYDYYNSAAVNAELGRSWSRDEVVAVARAQPLAFVPGTQMQYSNTNYYLLGMIIEAVTGNAYSTEVRDRIVGPLALDDTYVAGQEPATGPLARGYDRATGSFVDVTDLVDPTLTWSAGGIVSSTPDLAVFTRALFTGALLTPAMTTQMLTPEPLPSGGTSNHGLGPTIQVLPLGLGTFYSHLGRLQGYYGMIGYLPDHDAVMVELTDDQDGAPNPFMTQMWMVVGLL